MIDYCYITERPLPLDRQRIYAVVRAQSKPERSAVDSVLAEFFTESETGWAQNRVAEELEIYAGRAATNQQNGNLGGRPKKTQSVISEKTQTEPKNNLSQNPESRSTSTSKTSALDQPPLESKERNSDPPPPSAALENREDQAPTLRGEMAKVLRDEGVTITSGNPFLVEWVKRGVTIQIAREGVDRARIHKPKPEAIPAAYLDKIIGDLMNGKPVRSAVNAVPNIDTSCQRVLAGGVKCGMPGNAHPTHGFSCAHCNRKDEEARMPRGAMPADVRDALNLGSKVA